MAAATYNILIEQGASFKFSAHMQDENGDPIDITGSTIEAQIRKSTSDPNVIADFTITPVDLSNGDFDVSLSPSETSDIEVEPSGGAVRQITSYSWDLLITYAGGVKARLLQGVAKISPEVTQ